MHCFNCGCELPDDAKYCISCGIRVDQSDSFEKKTCFCRNCGGIMDMDEDGEMLTCPFCGTKEMIVESDAVKMQKIRSRAYQEAERERMDREAEAKIEEEWEREYNSFNSGRLKWAIILLGLINFCVGIDHFRDGYFLSALTRLASAALFMVSWLMGKQIIRSENKRLYELTTVAAIVVMLISFRFS